MQELSVTPRNCYNEGDSRRHAYHGLVQDERDVFQEGDLTPLSNVADMHSPATYTSVGSAVSNYVAPEAGPAQRDNSDEACMEFGHALPPIKSNSYNISNMLSPKLPGAAANTHFKSSHRLQTPKVHDASVDYSTIFTSFFFFS